jgi:hypothetical protein
MDFIHQVTKSPNPKISFIVRPEGPCSHTGALPGVSNRRL